MAAPLPRPGALFAGRYRVESVLGHGGMGTVFAVRDEKLNVACALKVVSALELTRQATRLIREARALLLISSAHVVRVFDVDEIGGVPYLVLERLEGKDLREVACDGRPLAPGVVADYAWQVCDALSQAHAVGVIHRDIKPSNLFLARLPDGREIVKVLDFGISKAAPGDDLGSLTSSHQALGSPQFISPEQIKNAKRVDARTDLWSLGVVMFRLLAGRYPFTGATTMAIQAAIAAGQRPALRDVAPGISPELAEIVERCLSVDPNARYASAADLGGALRPHVGTVTSDAAALHVTASTEAVTEEQTTEVVPAKPPVRSARRWVVLGVGFAVAVGVALALFPSTPRVASAPSTATPTEAPPAPLAPASATPVGASSPVPEAPSATEAPRVSRGRAHRSSAPAPPPPAASAPASAPAPASPPASSATGALRANPYR